MKQQVASINLPTVYGVLVSTVRSVQGIMLSKSILIVEKRTAIFKKRILTITLFQLIRARADEH